MRRLRLVALTLGVLAALSIHGRAQRTTPAAGQAPRPPNIVLIFADDLGYADIGPFGGLQGTRPATPNLDRMSAEGIRLTNFYVAQAVCSASRAALLTGSYPNRVGITGALNPNAEHGLNADETTIAEALKGRGYATAIFGKWHLGHRAPFLPTRHGFDEYLGLPYSNDMWPHHPTAKGFPALPLLEQDRVLRLNPDQSELTREYTGRAVRFIEKNRDRPFFAYLAHTMPHVPLFVSEAFKGKTGQGLYADVIAELDWSVGRILDAIARTGRDNDTLVIFTSDNGPWLSYGNHAGSAAPFREGKQTAFEGGVRVPFLARWPGRIPKGASQSLPAMTIDLLPTLAALAGAQVPQDRIIDGRNFWPLLEKRKDAAAPHDALYFYWGDGLHAVRSGRWKLHLPHPFQSVASPGKDGSPGKMARREIELSLFDLENDPAESENVVNQHPEIVAQLMQYVERAREDMGDALVKRTGRNLRAAGAWHQ